MSFTFFRFSFLSYQELGGAEKEWVSPYTALSHQLALNHNRQVGQLSIPAPYQQLLHGWGGEQHWLYQKHSLSKS